VMLLVLTSLALAVLLISALDPQISRNHTDCSAPGISPRQASSTRSTGWPPPAGRGTPIWPVRPARAGRRFRHCRTSCRRCPPPLTCDSAMTVGRTTTDSRGWHRSRPMPASETRTLGWSSCQRPSSTAPGKASPQPSATPTQALVQARLSHESS
jgi:hypothetical protein